MLHLLLVASIGLSAAPSSPAVDTSWFAGVAVRRHPLEPTDTVRRRRSVELSDWYYRRLTIHRWGSYVEFPLFAAEYLLGDKLMDRGTPVPGWVKPTHVAVAASLGGLFGLNTITGTWNLAEGWSQLGDNRKLVVAHTALMLIADAGFAGAGLIAGDARGVDGQRRHRAVAVASMGTAAIGTAIMWIGKR